MTDGKNPDPSPPKPVDFYRGETYLAEESIGFMMKRILSSISQNVESRLCEPGSPTFPQWIPLAKLQQGHAETVAELARECQLDTGAMTRLLDRLEAKGLVRRVRSQADRRVVNIELTEEGNVAAKDVPYLLAAAQNEYLAGFTKEEWEQLKGYLRRILDNAQTISARGEMKNDNLGTP